MKSQTGLAMISGIIKPRDQELNKAMQAVFSVMREKYPHGVLIVKSTGANLFEAETESAFFNEKNDGRIPEQSRIKDTGKYI